MNPIKVLFFLSILNINHLVHAQIDSATVLKVDNDNLSSNIIINRYDFENINKIPRYFKKSQIALLNKLEKKKDYQTQYGVLSKYVLNFGIENFYSETRLLWRLAKLTEMFGDYEDAKSLYRLVLRHHHGGINIDEIELYYDSLNNQEVAQFVPIEYYYEMVEHRKLIDTLMPPKGVLL
ncbi:MAG: OmpA family protein, partial [Cyclobacteriaceae bacterium]